MVIGSSAASDRQSLLGHDFLVKRVCFPAASGKWFEYTKFASWEGRFVPDSRPAIAVDAHDEHFQIIDLYGIQQLEADLKIKVLTKDV